MKKIFIKQDSILAKLVAKYMRLNRISVVIGRKIYLYNATAQEFIKNQRWLLHELKHVEQFERGALKFIRQYLWEFRRNGYYRNRFELEAREAENDTSLLGKYDLSLYMML